MTDEDNWRVSEADWAARVAELERKLELTKLDRDLHKDAHLEGRATIAALKNAHAIHLDLDTEFGDQLTVEELRGLMQDAARYRWLCAGNGYFLEEEGIAGPWTKDGKAEADQAIDERMARAKAKEGK